MLTLKECRKLVDPENQEYTEEELNEMLEFLSFLATTVVNDLEQKEYEQESSIDVSRVQR
ncbi:MAG: hypothetical protein ACI9UR_001512 [Bacteroidia bacterium]|jgi:hypothetical protein